MENKKHIDERDHHKDHKSRGDKGMEAGHMSKAVKHLERDKHMFERKKK